VVKYIAGGTALNSNAAPISIRRKGLRKWMPKWLWLTLKDLYLLKRDREQYQIVRDWIAREKPDLIYERITYMSTTVARAASEAGIPHFAEFNAPYPEERSKLEGKSLTLFLARKAEREQVHKATRVFTVSSILANHLAEATGESRSKMVVTPNAVNPLQFAPSEENQKALRLKWGLDEKEKVVGFVGSIFPYHGVDLLIDAFALVSSSSPLRLLVVGDGETLSVLRERVRGTALEKRIVFTGNVPYREIADYLAIMDVTVMAKSDWYMSPVKIFEYGLMRKAIVAQNTSPILDVMQHRIHGWIATPDVAGLQEGIQFLLSHPEDAQRMADAFHSKVLNEHTWDKVGETILKQYV
jgi:glycosyltransferase involved in cell wall biosynthesis